MEKLLELIKASSKDFDEYIQHAAALSVYLKNPKFIISDKLKKIIEKWEVQNGSIRNLHQESL